jgi:hypothetical protein
LERDVGADRLKEFLSKDSDSLGGGGRRRRRKQR